MEPDRWRRLKQLFLEARELAGPERRQFLDHNCSRDPGLLEDVESLLAADTPDEFMVPPFSEESETLTGRSKLVGAAIGPYQIHEVIGSGGMGQVFLASRADGAFDKRVAIKVLKQGLQSDELLARFQLERQSLARLEHPGIARLIDGGTTEDGRPYFVMEHIDGRRIDDYCTAKGLSTRERLLIFLRVCDAVHHAHQNLLIHRDLKPDNVLVTEAGEPKLLDFGIAKLLAPGGSTARTTLSQSPGSFMTPEYASPEQVRGEALTTATDVYSLGVVLYELLTGCLPYRLETRSLPEIQRVVCETEPQRPSLQDAAKQLRGDLDNIVLMALQKEPARRYASVEQFAEDLRRHLSGKPVIARVATLRYRAGRFIRRNKAPVLAAAILLLALVAGTVTTAWQAQLAAKQRDTAEANLAQARQITTFLVDLFSISDPAESEGQELTARQILDRGAEHVRTELSDQPRVQAALMHTIGLVYVKLGLFEPAEALLEEALAVRRRLLGERDPQVAETLNALGLLKLEAGDYLEAEQLSASALEIRQTLLGDEHVDTLETRSNLGLVYQAQARYDQAISTLRQVLEIRLRLFGHEAPSVAVSRNNLAGALYGQGDYAGAEALLREALETDRRVHSDRHPDVARRLNNIGLMRHAQGDYQGARDLYEQALEIRRQAYGENHPEVAKTLNNLGGVCLGEGDLRGAEAKIRAAIDVYRAVHGGDHPDVAQSSINLASILQQQERFEEAEALYREALAIQDRLRGEANPAIAGTLVRLGQLLMATGRAEEAEDPLRRALKIRSGAALEPDWITADVQTVLGRCLTLLNRLEEAEPLLLRSLEILEKGTPPGSAQAEDALSALVDLYRAWNQPETAALYLERLRPASPPAARR